MERIHTSNAEKQKAYRARQAAALTQTIAGKALPISKPLPTKPSPARWKALHALALAAVETLRDEMETYKEERSERWQESDRAGEMEDQIAAANDLIDSLEEFEFP